MFDHIFGNTFDLNFDGKTDEFERMIEYQLVMNEVRQSKCSEKSMNEISFDEPDRFNGIDPSISEF